MNLKQTNKYTRWKHYYFTITDNNYIHCYTWSQLSRVSCQKGPICLRMAGRALLAGYHHYVSSSCSDSLANCWWNKTWMNNWYHIFVCLKLLIYAQKLLEDYCNDLGENCPSHSETGMYPDSKVHGANMEPTWVLWAPGGPQVGPIGLAVRVSICLCVTQPSRSVAITP